MFRLLDWLFHLHKRDRIPATLREAMCRGERILLREEQGDGE